MQMCNAQALFLMIKKIAFFKKALSLSAFFVYVVLISTLIIVASSFNNNANAGTCSPSRVLGAFEKATVKWVYDGDTVLLTDKRKVRIIGIDTPEVKHHKQSGQAYGAKAREALRELLKKHKYRVLLKFGSEKKDRYKRLLAHVYLPDKTNVSTWLLEKGFAKTLSIPPNIKLADCYKQSERVAQRQSLKIWRLKKNQLKNINALSSRFKGYVRLQGKVHDVKVSRKTRVIELDSGSGSPIVIKIRKKHLKYFKQFSFNKLIDRKINVTGMIKKRRKKRILYLSHPSQLEIIPINRVKPTIKWSLKNEG